MPTTYAVEVTVKAWLTGHEFDLEYLVDLLPSRDVRVVKEGDQFYLTSTALDAAGDDAASGYDIAQRLLTQICGMARARDPDFKNVKLTGRYQDGEQTHVVGLAATLEIGPKYVGQVLSRVMTCRPLPLVPGTCRSPGQTGTSQKYLRL